MPEEIPRPVFQTGVVTQGLVPEIVISESSGMAVVAAKVRDARCSDKSNECKRMVYLVDDYFDVASTAIELGAEQDDLALSIETNDEPSTASVDAVTEQVREEFGQTPQIIVGFGGGTTLDTAKAVSNLLTNGGKAQMYQGWDLLTRPGVYKIGVPTISGTGAETSRTCVLTNQATQVKLGMNSRFSLFDSVVLDSSFSYSVPRDQFFFTGMDTYMHGIESLNGHYRNAFADALSREAVRLVREVFARDDMMSDENRVHLMIASSLGGTAIAGSYVGLIHPMSAALSVVFGTHHGVANCMVMRAMEGTYPAEYREFWSMVDRQEIEIPTLNGAALPQRQLDRLSAATMLHERPLFNALGPDYQKILEGGRLQELFSML